MRNKEFLNNNEDLTVWLENYNKIEDKFKEFTLLGNNF